MQMVYIMYMYVKKSVELAHRGISLYKMYVSMMMVIMMMIMIMMISSWILSSLRPYSFTSG